MQKACIERTEEVSEIELEEVQKKISDALFKIGLSNQKLAEEFEVSRNVISYTINNKRICKISLLIKIARKRGITLNKFFSETSQTIKTEEWDENRIYEAIYNFFRYRPYNITDTIASSTYRDYRKNKYKYLKDNLNIKTVIELCLTINGDLLDLLMEGERLYKLHNK